MSERNRTKTWWTEVSGAPRNWWSVPEVVRRWNHIITGNRDENYIRYVGQKYLNGKKHVTLLSLGCGAGEKECTIAEAWPYWEIHGFDLNPKRIEAARECAAECGLDNVYFDVADITQVNDVHDTFDIVLFDSSLHHFTDFTTLLPVVAGLMKDDGLLVINEYVGPDRFQWSKEQLRMANEVFMSIPEKFRRRLHNRVVKRRIYRPGTLRMILSDPSEAVQSSQILPAVHSLFSTVEEKALGGNLLHLVLKDIAHHFVNVDCDAMSVLRNLFDIEDRFLETHKPDFLFGIYKKKR